MVEVVLVVVVEIVVVDRAMRPALGSPLFRGRLTVLTALRLLGAFTTVFAVVLVGSDDRVLAAAAVAIAFSRKGPTMPSAATATAIVARRRRRPSVTPSPPARAVTRGHPPCHSRKC